MRKPYFLIVFALLASCQEAMPTTYEECLQKNLKGIESDIGARYISQSCRGQFPLPYNKYAQFR